MSTIRTHKQRSFSVLDNHPIEDMNLSWEALGVLTYLLSKPDDWRIQIQHLINLDRGAGRDKLYGILKNLEDAGYLARRREQGPDGKFTWVRELYESPDFNPFRLDAAAKAAEPSPVFQDMAEPSPEKPYTDEPYTAQPYTEKPTLLNTEVPNTEAVRTDPPRTEGEDERNQPAALTPPPPPSLEKGNVEALAEALATAAGLNPLAIRPGKKWAEITGYAAKLAVWAIPDQWACEPDQAGPITPDHILRFVDWWQSARPVGNSAEDRPHPRQIFERLCTQDAIAWITAQQTHDERNAAARKGWDERAPQEAPGAPDLPAPDPAATAVWSQVLAELQLSLQRPVYDNWLRNTAATGIDETNLVVTVPTPFALEWLSQRMNGMLKQRVQRITGRAMHITFQLPASSAAHA